jgi:hypothetical protein
MQVCKSGEVGDHSTPPSNSAGSPQIGQDSLKSRRIPSNSAESPQIVQDPLK